MTPILRSFLVCALLVALPPGALAGALAPAKASDVVALLILGTECDGGQRILPNGTHEPFEIPAKQVFVVTSATIERSGVGAGERVRSTLYVATGTPPTETAVAVTDAVGGEGGIAIGTFLAPTGVVIARGSRLCVNSSGLVGAYVQGFFAKDK